MSIPPAAVAPRRPAASPLDVAGVRADFPILNQTVHGRPLVYFDNAATSQKPQAVLDAVDNYYRTENANVHRAVHLLSERATRAFEEARGKVARFLNAAEAREIIFVRGTTEGINLVASCFSRKFLAAGDEILITGMEHHSNIVPWQMVCEERGCVLKVVPINDEGELDLAEYERLLGPKTKLVSVVHLSNSLGTINPVRRMIELAHARGVPVLVDGAQAAPHLVVDVQDLDCDFFTFSGHKLYGPMGIGVLYGKARLLEALPPYMGGGDMIRSVTFAKTTYADLPNKFEAGTPNVAGAIGLGAAIDYVQAIGLEQIAAHDDLLLSRATERLREMPGARIVGTAAHKAAVISFVVEDPPISALDLGTRLDLEGIAVRTGHHCCQPVMDRFNIPGTARVSFAVYNTLEEVDQFADALRDVIADVAARARTVTASGNANADATAQARSEPTYPRVAAANPAAAAEELAEVFEFFDDWPDRYQYLIELGQDLPPLPEYFKTEANRVRGCQSTVFFAMRRRPGTADVFEFLGDSDADLVRGLIGLLQRVYSGQKAADVLAFDVEGFFARLGLDQHLTLGRRNGLASMVQRIRRFAAALAKEPAAARD
jgi:cysteine desulfurase/selenocysteine lyase